MDNDDNDQDDDDNVERKKNRKKKNSIYSNAVSWEWTRPEYFMHTILWPSVRHKEKEIKSKYSCEGERTYRRTSIIHRCHCRYGNEKNHTETSNKMVLHCERVSRCLLDGINGTRSRWRRSLWQIDFLYFQLFFPLFFFHSLFTRHGEKTVCLGCAWRNFENTYNRSWTVERVFPKYRTPFV